MSKSNGGKIDSAGLDLPIICDICGKPRAKKKHPTCSKIRQQRYKGK